MLKIISIVTALGFCIALPACSVLVTPKNFNNETTEWDFDHNLQFRYSRLTTNSYQLEVISNNKIKFDKLAAFLLRESYKTCGSYHYKIEIIQGIEGVDDKRAMPNYIHPSLIANIEC